MKKLILLSTISKTLDSRFLYIGAKLANYNKNCIFLILIISIFIACTSCNIASTEKLKVVFEDLQSKDENEIRSLIEHGANVNVTNNKGEPLLYVASEYGQERIVKLLLEAKANVEKREPIFGATPLMRASINGNKEIVKMLLDAGADVNNGDLEIGKGSTPKYSATLDDPPCEIVMLVSQGGATPLWWASKEGHTEIVKLLLEAKADVNVPDKTNGVAPICVAASFNYTDIVRILIDYKVNVNVAARNGATPLFWACIMNNPKTVKRLLDAGADINTVTVAEDGTEFTPLRIAEINSGSNEIVQLLKEYGIKN